MGLYMLIFIVPSFSLLTGIWIVQVFITLNRKQIFDHREICNIHAVNVSWKSTLSHEPFPFPPKSKSTKCLIHAALNLFTRTNLQMHVFGTRDIFLHRITTIYEVSLLDHSLSEALYIFSFFNSHIIILTLQVRK